MAGTDDPARELLLEHAGWVRRLARRLVRDDAAADDLAQDAFVRALERPPEPGRPVRGWLATVVRNLAAQGARGSGRRRSRDEASARPEADDPALDVVARATAQREVARAVLELDEPLRATLLLRYFDERSPTAIAELQRVPLATVKARLARGRELLRERLDRAHGGDARAWLALMLTPAERALVAPLASASTAVTPASSLPLHLGALVLNVKLVLVVLAVALVGSLAILVSRDGASAASAEEQAAVEPADALLQASEGLVAEAPDERREPGAAAPAPAETERARSAGSDAPPAAAEATAADVVRGRVIDATSRPIGGVEIRRGGGGETPRGGGETARGKDAESSAAIALDEGGAALRTAADGTFEIAADALGGNRPLLVEDAGWTTVLGGSPVRASTGRETAIVVAPRVSLVGRVIDDTAGAPVGGADVRVQPPADLRAGIDANLDYSVNRDWSVRTEPDGSFALDAPLLEGALLVARAKGFETSSEPLPPGGEHVIVLTAAPLASDVLRGRVIDAAGGVVPGAQVSLGLDTTRTDEAGEFAFRFDDERSFHRRLNEMRERRGHSALVADTLLALAPGALPGRYTAPRNGAGEPVWPGFVTLRLGAEPREIGGRVLDFDGEPIADATVWIADPTFFGGLAGESPGGMPDMVHAETVLAGGPTRAWTTTETDEDGRYLIGGLLDRDYRIEAMDPDTMLRAVLEDVASGTHNAVLRMPEEAVYPTLSGVVIGNDGEPVAGASVFPMCDAFVLTVGGATMSTNHASVDGVTTDADGKFALVGVPKELVYLRIQGAEVLPLEWGRHVEGGLASLVDERPEKLQIRVDRRCQFLVELIEPSEADEFELFAADGRQLEISEFFGTQRREGTRKSLIDGRSNPMAASDAAAEIVLYLEGEEVRRAPVRLLPGERRTLQP